MPDRLLTRSEDSMLQMEMSAVIEGSVMDVTPMNVTPFWVTNVIKINNTGSYLGNKAKIGNRSQFDYSLS